MRDLFYEENKRRSVGLIIILQWKNDYYGNIYIYLYIHIYFLSINFLFLFFEWEQRFYSNYEL